MALVRGLAGLEGAQPVWAEEADDSVDIGTYARRVAKRRGVPEDTLLAILGHESEMNVAQARRPDFGNGGGVGQFTTDTARQYGTTQEELRNDWRKAVDLSAQKLSDDARYFKGDFTKAQAAYFLGSGNIEDAVRQGGEDGWQRIADRQAQGYGYQPGTLFSYLGAPPSAVPSGEPQTGEVGGLAAPRAILGGTPLTGDTKPISQLLDEARQKRRADLAAFALPRATLGEANVGDIPANAGGGGVATPAGLEDIQAPTGSLRARLLGQPETDYGTVTTRPHTETTDNPLALASGAYEAINPDIPVYSDVARAMKPYVGQAARYTLNPEKLPLDVLRRGAGLAGLDIPDVTNPSAVARAAGLSVPNVPTPADVEAGLVEGAIPVGAADVALTAAPFAGEAVRGGRAVLGAASDEAAIRLAANETFDRLAPASWLRHERAGAAVAQEAAGFPVTRGPFARPQGGLAALSEEDAAALARGETIQLRRGGAAAGREFGPEVAAGRAGENAYAARVRQQYVERMGEDAAAAIDGRLAKAGKTWADFGDALNVMQPAAAAHEVEPAREAVTGFRGDPTNPDDVAREIRRSVQAVREERAGQGTAAQMQQAAEAVRTPEAAPERPRTTWTIKPAEGEAYQVETRAGPVSSSPEEAQSRFAQNTADQERLNTQMAVDQRVGQAQQGAEGVAALRSGAEGQVVRVAVKPEATKPLDPNSFVGSRGAVELTDPAGARVLAPGEAPAAGEQVMYHGTGPQGVEGPLRVGTNLTPNEADAANFARSTTRLAGARQGRIFGGEVGGGTLSGRRAQDAAATRDFVAGLRRDEPPPENVPAGSWWANFLNEARGTVSAPISLKSSLSPPFLRQGLARIVTSPGKASDELAQSLKAALKGEGASAELQDTIAQNLWVRSTAEQAPATSLAGLRGEAFTGQAFNRGYTWQDVGGTLLDWRAGKALEDMTTAELRQVAERAGIEVSNQTSRQTLRERLAREFKPEELAGFTESRVGHAAERLVAPSERQAVLELNLHRTNWYSEVAQQMWDAGIRDVNQYTELRKTIEQFTQRGAWKQPTGIPVFFSTRAWSGRAQAAWRGMAALVRPGEVLAGPGPRREAAKAFLGMVGASMMFVAGGYAAADAMGLKPSIVMNNTLPTLVVGGEHFDPWAGWTSQARVAVGVAADVVKAFGDDPANAPQNIAASAYERSLKMARGSLSPVFGKAADIVTKQDFSGAKYNLAKDITSGGFATNLVAPFIVESLFDAFKEDGAIAAAAQGPWAFLSGGGGSYRTPSIHADETAQQIFGRKFDDLTTGERLRVLEDLPDEAKKSVVRDERSAYHDRLDAAGYNDPSADKTQLDREHPELNAQRWYFEHTPLASLQGVDEALALAIPGREIRLAGTKRAINQDEQSRKAWDDSKKLLDAYLNRLVPEVAPAAIAELAKKDKAYRDSKGDPKKWEQLSATQRGEITGAVHDAARKDPTLDATLAWWGVVDKPQKGHEQAFLNVLQRYGATPYETLTPAVSAGIKATASAR